MRSGNLRVLLLELLKALLQERAPSGYNELLLAADGETAAGGASDEERHAAARVMDNTSGVRRDGSTCREA